jgi:hypothetical protein
MTRARLRGNVSEFRANDASEATKTNREAATQLGGCVKGRGREIRGGEFHLEILRKQEDIELRRQFKNENVRLSRKRLWI